MSIKLMIEKIKEHEFLERKYYDFINNWGDCIANEVIRVIDSKKEENCIFLFNKLSWLFDNTTKINFLNEKKLFNYFTEDYFDKNNERINGFYDYICWSLCNKRKIKRPEYWEVIQDLIGFDRTGEKFEFQRYMLDTVFSKLERKYYDFINNWGDCIANEINKITDSCKEENCIELVRKLYWLHRVTPKFNFLNKEKLLNCFMNNRFDKTNPEIERITGVYKYICWTLCKIKKDDVNYWDALIDLAGFERKGKVYEF